MLNYKEKKNPNKNLQTEPKKKKTHDKVTTILFIFHPFHSNHLSHLIDDSQKNNNPIFISCRITFVV